MVDLIKKNVSRIGFYGWLRFLAGLIILCLMLVYDIHYESEVEVWLYTFPAYLLGMDIKKVVQPK